MTVRIFFSALRAEWPMGRTVIQIRLRPGGHVLDGEALGLHALGYFKFYCIGLYCPDHGAIRCAITFESENRHPCPICSRSCDRGFLGIGYTRRELPFFEVLWTPPVWIIAGEVEAAEPEPLRAVASDHYIGVKGRVAKIERWPYNRPQAP